MTQKNDSVAKKATRNSIYSMLVSGWYLLSRFLLTPFVLHYLTIAEYGLWSLCFVVMSFLAMTSIGFEGAYVKYVAEFNSRNESERINSLMSTGLVLTTILALILVSALWVGMGPLLDILDIEEELRRTAGVVFIGTGLVFALDISLNCFGRALDGMQYIALTAKVRLFTSFLEIALIVVFLIIGLGVYGMMWAFLIRYLLSIIINMFFAFKLIPGLRVGFGLCSKTSLKLFVSYGGKMQLLGFIGIFMSTYDRLVITRLLGLASTGMYEVGRKIPQTATRIPSEISGVLMPALSHLQGDDDLAGARTLILDASRYIAMLSAILFCYIFAVSEQAIYVWLGRGYEEAVIVMYVVSAGVLVHMLTGVSSAAARGLARLDWEIRYTVFNLVLCLIMTPLLALWLGLVGAALGMAGGTAISSIYFISITNRHFKVSLPEYCRHVLQPVIACMISGAVLFVLLPVLIDIEHTHRGIVAFELVAAGVLYAGVSVLLLWASCGITATEKQRILHQFSRVLRRSEA